MSNNRDLSAAAAQIGFHNSNIGIGTDAPSETITLNHANGASIGLEYDGIENGTINVNSAAMYARAGSGKHLILGGNATESLRITSAGLVGINDTSPDATLSVGGSTAFIDVGAAGGNRGKIGYSSNDLYFGTSSSSGEFIFKNNVTSTDNPASSGTEKLRIDSKGQASLRGTTTAFDGTGAIAALQMYYATDSGQASIGPYSNGGSTHLSFYTNSGGAAATEKLRITSAGNVGINQTSPSRALSVYDGQSSVNTVIRVGTNAVSTTTDGYAQVEFKHGSASSAWIWHQANSTTGYGGPNGLVFYNGNAADYAFYSGGNNERLRISSAGVVTIPKQPSFGCIKNGSQYPTSAQRDTIAPWTEHFDQGSNFNATTGVFTAPVAGKYYFYVSVMMDRNDNGDYQISIYKNGAMYYNSNDMVSNTNVTFLQTTVCGIVEMSANDTVEFKMFNSSSTSSFIYSGSYTHCGGHLIG